MHSRFYSGRHARRPARVFLLAALLAPAAAAYAQGDLDGHGPDAWRVTGISSSDVLNARMGPGTQYPVIESFAHNEGGLQQVTCVPFHTPAQYMAMSQAELDALPPRWCLMRDAGMTKAGWVAQRYITPDGTVSAEEAGEPQSSGQSGDDMIAAATSLVQQLYDGHARAQAGSGPDPLDPANVTKYFTRDIADFFASGGLQAHPLYGAQDFDGRVTRVAPDSDSPMFRGMVTINVDFINFGQPQQAVFYLRADTEQPGAPLRIFRVEQDGWSYP